MDSRYVIVKGNQQIRPETAFGTLGLFDKLPAENNFIKEALCQIFGLLVAVTFAA